jgi:hypothetical protein
MLIHAIPLLWLCLPPVHLAMKSGSVPERGTLRWNILAGLWQQAWRKLSKVVNRIQQNQLNAGIIARNKELKRAVN